METSRCGILSTRWTSVYMSISLLLSVCSLVGVVRSASSDYGQALKLSFKFLEAQRSGYLPDDYPIQWRFNSGILDGSDQGVDLVGGYYDAGDNVKFGLPMAFTITTLSWSVVAYQAQLSQQGQLLTALDGIRWGTDYFIKAHPQPDVLWAEVGDGQSDHQCWERPESMTTPRNAYKVDTTSPGSEVAGETAAAFAAASIAFSSSDPAYAAICLTHAKQLFTFADTHRGHYDISVPMVKAYYQSGPSGYNDELLWGAVWLYEATDDNYYLKYIVDNAVALGGTGWGMTEFGWDVKYVGVQVVAAKILLEGRGGAYTSTLQAYKNKADFFMCAALGKNSGTNLQRSPGGMLFTQAWNNMQFVSSGSFLLTYYADLLNAHSGQLYCSGNLVQPTELLNLAQSQADYILGNNPRGVSYLVGYGQNFPRYVHHRGASIPSIRADNEIMQCYTGYSEWYSSQNPNPNVLVGALVGGPDQSDNFIDSRNNWEMNEACTYNNAPLVGLLARLAGGAQPSPLPSLASFATVTTPPESQAASLHIIQHFVNSWQANTISYYKYQGVVTNDSEHTLEDFTLTFEFLDGPLYGLTQVEGSANSFTFPDYPTSLLPGEALKFVYISHHSTPSVASFSHTKFD